jgi:hypothetical protein
MQPNVHRWLDGELPREALSAADAADLAEWEALQPLLQERRRTRAPAWLAGGVMRALETAGEVAAVEQPGRASSWRAALHWLVTPRPIRIPPLAPLAMAGVLAFAVLRAVGGPSPAPLPPAELLAGAPVVYVQFTLDAAGARSVSVAGDFNDWSTETGVLRDVDGNGVWSGMVAVTPGVHKYMFLIDGEEWVTDPVAEGYVDDGFGMRNALLAVATPESAP